MIIEQYTWNRLSAKEKEKLFLRSELDIHASMEIVQPIIEAVKKEGDSALHHFTKKFEGVDLGSRGLMVSNEEFDAAEELLDSDVKKALKTAIKNVRKFHENQVPKETRLIEISEGIKASERPSPLESVGLYVPRGRGSFPSMLYMLAIPAIEAGVPEIVVTSPPNKDGSIDPACLYVAQILGIKTFLKVGGAQSIAALAFGTETVPAVKKVMGPGSMYVTAAKRALSHIIDPGLPAGPSESMILSDGTANAETVARDLMIEAEHGSDSAAILVTDSIALADEVTVHLKALIPELPEPRRTFLQDVFAGYGGIILAEDMDEACTIVNEFAPEHLQIQGKSAQDLQYNIKNAGEILIGSFAPFSIANYAIGVNAVLPTGSKAKTWSAVSVRDFIKYSSIVEMTEIGYKSLRDQVISLAQYEGFPAHAQALEEDKHRFI